MSADELGHPCNGFRQQIAAAALILNSGVGLPFRLFDDLEVCCPQRIDHRCDLMEMEVQIDCRAKQVVTVDHLVADVKRDEHKAAGDQDSTHFRHEGSKVAIREMHDGIEEHHAGEAGRLEIQVSHVANPEIHGGVETGRAVDHARGNVDPDRLRASISKVLGDVPGSASNVCDEASVPGGLNKSIQQMTVKRLVRQFAGNMFGVRMSCRVITLSNVHASIVTKAASYLFVDAVEEVDHSRVERVLSADDPQAVFANHPFQQLRTIP
jgi:hypothetical protein